jgi:hypothetical protein
MADAATDGRGDCFVSPIRHQVISEFSDYAEGSDI